MIRVEITETMWRTHSGVVCNVEPVDVGDDIPILKTERTMLVQEFSELAIRPIAAYLNGLQEPVTCQCGHPKHEGRCPVRRDGGMGYSDRQCECTKYQTPDQAEMARTITSMKAELLGAHQKNAKLSGHLEEKTRQRQRLVADLEKVIRSRDRLRQRR